MSISVNASTGAGKPGPAPDPDTQMMLRAGRSMDQELKRILGSTSGSAGGEIFISIMKEPNGKQHVIVSFGLGWDKGTPGKRGMDSDKMDDITTLANNRFSNVPVNGDSQVTCLFQSGAAKWSAPPKSAKP